MTVIVTYKISIKNDKGKVSAGESTAMMDATQNKKIARPHGPAILLLGIYPNESKSACHRGACTSMFTAALYTTIKR